MIKVEKFKDLNLIKPLQKAVTDQGYEKPTAIQSQAIPALLGGKDLIGVAQTGTGKTAAFTLPILQKMKEGKPHRIKTLVLTPTRELAAQVHESFVTYGKYLDLKYSVVFGGVKQRRQVRVLSAGVDVLVATPGRLLDLMNQRKLSLSKVDFFVLDEADRMLDMGFIPDIKRVIAKLPSKRQSLFFSATMSPTVNKLAQSLLTDPVRVEVAAKAITVDRIKQELYYVDQTDKFKLLIDLFESENFGNVLIFTRTKHKANKLVTLLNKNNISADAIHGNKSQYARTKAITNFKNGKTRVLVATDIVARGIDIPDISHVINYELPNEIENYVHRIGRTARAGNKGIAFSFCAAHERYFLREIERLIKQKIEVIDHKYHSEIAKNATGAAAKPLRRRRTFRKKSSGKGNSSNGRRNFSRSRKRRSKSSSGKKGSYKRYGNTSRNSRSKRRRKG